MSRNWLKTRPRPAVEHRAAASLTDATGSGQVIPRHPKMTPYRCFLSDLTGLGGLRRTRPSRQHRSTAADTAVESLRQVFGPL